MLHAAGRGRHRCGAIGILGLDGGAHRQSGGGPLALGIAFTAQPVQPIRHAERYMAAAGPVASAHVDRFALRILSTTIPAGLTISALGGQCCCQASAHV